MTTATSTATTTPNDHDDNRHHHHHNSNNLLTGTFATQTIFHLDNSNGRRFEKHLHSWKQKYCFLWNHYIRRVEERKERATHLKNCKVLKRINMSSFNRAEVDNKTAQEFAIYLLKDVHAQFPPEKTTALDV